MTGYIYKKQTIKPWTSLVPISSPKHRLIFVTDSVAAGNYAQIINGLPRNSWVILRDYDLENRYEYALSIRNLCKKRRVKLIVGVDSRLAIKIKADGLHIPEKLLCNKQKWQHYNRHWIITTSCHSLRAAVMAMQCRIDNIILSPIFPTLSHPLANNLGVIKMGRMIQFLCRKTRGVNIYPLGGINKGNIKKLKDFVNIAGFAATRGF